MRFPEYNPVNLPPKQEDVEKLSKDLARLREILKNPSNEAERQATLQEIINIEERLLVGEEGTATSASPVPDEHLGLTATYPGFEKPAATTARDAAALRDWPETQMVLGTEYGENQEIAELRAQIKKGEYVIGEISSKLEKQPELNTVAAYGTILKEEKEALTLKRAELTRLLIEEDKRRALTTSQEPDPELQEDFNASAANDKDFAGGEVDQLEENLRAFGRMGKVDRAALANEKEQKRKAA